MKILLILYFLAHSVLAEFYEAQSVEEFWSILSEQEISARHWSLCQVEIDQKIHPTNCFELIEGHIGEANDTPMISRLMARINRECSSFLERENSLPKLEKMKKFPLTNDSCRSLLEERIKDVEYQKREIVGPDFELLETHDQSNNFTKPLRN